MMLGGGRRRREHRHHSDNDDGASLHDDGQDDAAMSGTDEQDIMMMSTKRPHRFGSSAFEMERGRSTVQHRSVKTTRMIKLLQGEDYFEAVTFEGEDTMYVPLTQPELLINVSRFDEISFSEGEAFLCDEKGVYQEKAHVFMMCCWRYCEASNCMRVLRAFVTPNLVSFHRVKSSFV